MSAWSISQRRVCRVLQLDPKSYRYKSRRAAQAALEAKIKEICQTRIRYGYRRVHVLLRREGWMINWKKTRRISNVRRQYGFGQKVIHHGAGLRRGHFGRDRAQVVGKVVGQARRVRGEVDPLFDKPRLGEQA